MSLINDALRRAKQAQEQAPPPPTRDLPFRPVEPAQQRARRGLGLLLPATMAAVACLVLLCVWQWTQMRGRAAATEVNARTSRAPLATVPASALVERPAPVQAAATRPTPATGAAVTPAADAADEVTGDLFADMEDSAATDDSAIATVTPPKPAPLRLQAIIFSPKRPSAMISGKTLFVGDKLGDLLVVAIDRDSATLVGAGQTNILGLAK